MRELDARVGPIDLLVNNAGRSMPRGLDDITGQTIAVNGGSLFL